MKIFLILRAFIFFSAGKAKIKTNPKNKAVNSTDNETKSASPTKMKDNPIQTITFEGGNKNPVCKVLFYEKYDGNLILYRSTTPNEASSYTIYRIINTKDIKKEGEYIRKFKLDDFSNDDKKYTYCVAVSNGKGKDDNYFSEPFQFCESQNKFMLTREAKNHKHANRAAWVALGLAIAALTLVLLVIVYKFFC
ncbi:hypothetical protein TUBRATIS_008610 [Tubulinosema ratisbonensis]|uniref:Uncharacterized protein n=1 Tax=Tubulinosema ratisbonensis TaxID=291195 RepID=A0A437ANF6_9MICR|nr:hypothetical protein TUBRATIS_008610 [Tubulinosema ratisbonensis]